MATPIGSPRVPSTVGSSLVTPAARDDVEPDESADAARCASHASLARFANASLLASPAEDDQSALLHVPLLPCIASATPGTFNASMLSAADARALPALPAFPATASLATHPSFPTDSSSCPLSLRGDPEGARALFGSGPCDHAPWHRCSDNAPGHGSDAPANDFGRGLADADPGYSRCFRFESSRADRCRSFGDRARCR